MLTKEGVVVVVTGFVARVGCANELRSSHEVLHE